jgi:hypothetical protein
MRRRPGASRRSRWHSRLRTRCFLEKLEIWTSGEYNTKLQTYLNLLKICQNLLTMERRKLAETSPPTLTSREVSAVFFDAISPNTLQYLDERQYVRPSFYYAADRPGSLLRREDRDLLVQSRGKQRGDPRRRFSYDDLVWIRLFVYVSDYLKQAKATRPLQRAGEILRLLKTRTPEGCPPAWRLVFFGKDVYLLEEATAVSLTDGQLALTQLLTDNVEAEVKGRIEALVALQRIRPIPTKCSFARTERMSA